MKKGGFTINGLDHVAIRVEDLERSALWYEEVLGLKQYQLEAWGEYPIFMMAGKSGVALFPKNEDDHRQVWGSPSVDHFAFNVDKEAFHQAILLYKDLQIKYTIKDHTYFKSVYVRDPDQHIVELTTIMVPEETFYKA